MYEFEVGDYIKFHRIVQPERPLKFTRGGPTGAPVVVPEIPEQVLPQSGSGQILKFSAKPRKVKSVDRSVNGTLTERVEVFRTATVAAGTALGSVCAILDDATLDAKPMTLDLGLDSLQESTGPGMYGTDVKGGA